MQMQMQMQMQKKKMEISNVLPLLQRCQIDHYLVQKHS